MKRVLVLVLVAVPVLLAGCARTLPPATIPPPPGPIESSERATPSEAPPPTCPPDGVRLEMESGDAASGLRILGIDLVNCGRATYRVDGYPAVRPLDEKRAVLDVQVLHGVHDITISVPEWDGPPSPVVLKPGQRAEAAVVWRNTYDNITHPPVTVPFLEVAPAPGKPVQVLAANSPLDLGSTGKFGISPWRAIEPVIQPSLTSTKDDTVAQCESLCGF